MKVNWNTKYTTIAVYAFIVVVLSIIFYLIVSEVSLFKIQVNKYLSIFQPIIIGFVMAYIFNFILEFFETVLLSKIFTAEKHRKIKRIVGIVLTYLVVALLFYLFLKFVLPQLISSIMGLVNDIPGYFTAITNKIGEITNDFYIGEEYYDIILAKWNEFVEYILRFATDLVPKLGYLTKAIISSIWNIALGIIISIYLLLDKERFKALSKKMILSIFSEKNANRIMVLVNRIDHIFGRFLSGKILDSLIIGVLTFIVLKIVKMPYVILVSFIVGITNIIPFFGPFIGAIPSFFIIFFVSPVKGFWFLLIILIIQQIDGNIIGPKILGDSLGISAFWILFSLLVAGKILGFVGMIIGVPLFVFIYSIIKDIVEYRLEKKELPRDTKEYY
ncbi:AI-2E family transporter [Tepidimicrobium xylanilyticum]|uniref:Predicted PurR-regulated permease PerM n=1 Tax=Tepidimicrobium xylanilyticum TaxID=1123352 RepID=A0A1H2Q9Z8_9FIRM|nr:AI-2E family transporter [Tepidimicrobium xylanilyticum]GMG95708.1 AI-2E family transporter [Tepidimicrobium xylanilyticum]SDW03981.1 Predicted PurR-regulated permease PerM [Tepidimicrobium xylanilyticum]